MRRREFITILGGAAVAWSLAARAQQSTIPVVGFLGGESPDLFADRFRAFRQGLKETGYVEGQNLVIEYRWAEGHNDRLSAHATDLVRCQVAVIVASGTPSALAAMEATAAISIVFFVAGDPVELGLVDFSASVVVRSDRQRQGGAQRTASSLGVHLFGRDPCVRPLPANRAIAVRVSRRARSSSG